MTGKPGMRYGFWRIASTKSKKEEERQGLSNCGSSCYCRCVATVGSLFRMDTRMSSIWWWLSQR